MRIFPTAHWGSTSRTACSILYVVWRASGREWSVLKGGSATAARAGRGEGANSPVAGTNDGNSAHVVFGEHKAIEGLAGNGGVDRHLLGGQVPKPELDQEAQEAVGVVNEVPEGRRGEEASFKTTVARNRAEGRP